MNKIGQILSKRCVNLSGTKTALCALFAAATLTSVRGGDFLPTQPGTNWTYEMTQELGTGVSLPGATPGKDGKIRTEVVYRLDGSQVVDGTDFLKFEMHRDHKVTNTELITIDDHGIRCSYRILPDGERVRLNPPQTIVASPLLKDNSWDFDGTAGSSHVHQHYIVMGEQEITVPAGKFQAVRILGEQKAPDDTTIERWFVPGVGIVKDVTTMRNEKGDRLQRVELVLKQPPQVGPRPDVKEAPPAKALEVGLSAEPVGGLTTKFSTDTPKIYARWKGHNLKKDSVVRAVWIAQDIGSDAPQNYTIDEATANPASPNAYGSFVLNRPEDGWAPGTYRVEFYVDDVLIETVTAQIKQDASP